VSAVEWCRETWALLRPGAAAERRRRIESAEERIARAMAEIERARDPERASRPGGVPVVEQAR